MSITILAHKLIVLLECHYISLFAIIFHISKYTTELHKLFVIYVGITGKFAYAICAVKFIFGLIDNKKQRTV